MEQVSSDFAAHHTTFEWIRITLAATSTALQFPRFLGNLLGIFVNLLHITILFHQSMRNSATNIVLIEIAICDLIAMSTASYYYFFVDRVMLDLQNCTQPVSENFAMFILIISSFYHSSKRISVWLVLFLAAIRTISIKLVYNKRFDFLNRPRFAIVSLFLALFIGVPAACLYYAHGEIRMVGVWQPPDWCTNFPQNFSQIYYKVEVNKSFQNGSRLIPTTYFSFEAMTMGIPCILFIPLTIILIREMKKGVEMCAIASKKRERTTRLVTCITITVVVFQLPLSLINIFQVFIKFQPNLYDIGLSLTRIIMTFMPISSIIHCLICFSLSSQYRDTIRKQKTSVFQTSQHLFQTTYL